MESHPGMTDSKAPQAADHEGRWETAGRAGGPPLFHEDFSAFPVGQLPYDYSPIGEYHCVIPEGYLGPWVELTTHHSWRRSVGWNIGEDGGQKHLEHVALREAIPSILAAGDPLWGDAELTVELRLPAREKAAGLAFRLQTSQQYYALLLGADGTASLVKADFDNCLTVLAVAALPAVPDGWHRAQIRLDGPRMQAVLDGQTTLTAEDDEYQRGRIALVAWAPARYREVDVRASAPEAAVRAGLCSQEAREQAALLERLPRPHGAVRRTRRHGQHRRDFMPDRLQALRRGLVAGRRTPPSAWADQRRCAAPDSRPRRRRTCRGGVVQGLHGARARWTHRRPETGTAHPGLERRGPPDAAHAATFCSKTAMGPSGRWTPN